MDESEIVEQFKRMKAEQSNILSKISELETESNEHTLVINAIEKLEPERKCFRLVGGVLVERTVGEVLPAVKRNRDGLSELLEKLNQQLNEKSRSINEFVTKYKIQTQPQAGDGGDRREKKSSGGVLV